MVWRGSLRFPGVTDRRFAQLARLAHRVHRDAHVLHPVQRVEHPEHVHAVLRGLVDEVADDVVGVVRVADRVGRAQQHLQQHVRHRRAERDQAFPGTFPEEAHRDVERCAAPALHREQRRGQPRVRRRDGDQVARAQSGSQQRLVRVAERRVREQHGLVLQHPLRELRRAHLVELLPGASRRLADRQLGRARLDEASRPCAADDFRVAVDDHVAHEAQQPRRAVPLARESKQLRRLVDELGGVFAALEQRMRDHLVEKAQVGHHAAHAELLQRAVHARDGFVRSRRPGRHLYQQRVVRARDEGAGVGRAGIQADAEAGRAAIGGDAAVIGDEVVFRILGRDTALHGVAGHADAGLRRHAARRGADGRALGDPDLRLDDVDARDHLGDRVLDLDARIDLDEIDLTGVGVLQELDRARVEVVNRAADAQRQRAERLPLGVVQEHGWRALDDLLVAPLHGAVALEQVHEVAVAVAEDLHLDVACTAHQLLEIDLVVAERGLGFAARRGNHLRELLFALDDAHPAPAPAPARFQHHRVTDRPGQSRGVRGVVRQRRRRGHDRHARGRGEIARRHLVAEAAHDLGGRADERDAGRFAGVRKFRIFGEEAIARVDRVGAGLLRHANDAVDVEIRVDRALALADEVAFVRLHPVQRKPVFLRVDRNRADAELVRGAHDANGNLAAVGDQQGLDLAGWAHGNDDRAWMQ